jgi:hypothetical protein
MKNRIVSISGKGLLILAFCTISILSSITVNLNAQQVEIQGKAKVSVMDTANSENLLVVKKADGTLATRQVSSLPPDQPDTIRTYATDIELNRLMCDCGNDVKPFLVKSSLAKGYSVQDLVDAGVPVANLVAGEVSVIDLIASGVSYANLVAGGVSIVDLFDIGATPLDIYNGGVPKDTLYGKMYQGGLIFYLDTHDTIPGIAGLVAAPMDQSTATEWGCIGTDIPNVPNVTVSPPSGFGANVGDGQMNTDSILTHGCVFGFPAANMCDTLTLNGYDDWFLPSILELGEMYTNLHLSGYGSFAWNYYWSSTEYDGSYAWWQRFNNFNQVQWDKDYSRWVRAARAF